MTHSIDRSFWLIAALCVAISACGPVPVRHANTRSTHGSTASSSGSDGLPNSADIPPNIAAIPDAVPRYEKRSALGNPDSYEVYGERYIVLNDFSGFKERGIASWYGKKFHGKNTSSGEPYDMFLMTAAHKTLPIPCYVRVTNLSNQRSAIVRVNDRGPFHSDRIIDLSYVAALKLGIIGVGSAPVEIEALTPSGPGSPSPMLTAQSAAPVTQSMTAPPAKSPGMTATSAAPAPNAVTIAAAISGSTSASASMPVPMPTVIGADLQWLQAGAFLDQLNAATLREQLNGMGIGNVQVKEQLRGSQLMHRVLIGPFADAASRDTVRSRLSSVQLASMPVAD